MCLFRSKAEKKKRKQSYGDIKAENWIKCVYLKTDWNWSFMWWFYWIRRLWFALCWNWHIRVDYNFRFFTDSQFYSVILIYFWRINRMIRFICFAHSFRPWHIGSIKYQTRIEEWEEVRNHIQIFHKRSSEIE